MDKREQILQATADLIAEMGLQNCPMAQVAKKAGVGAGTIYRYFETKEELIQQLYLCVCQRMADYCLQNYSAAASIRARFDHILGNFYQFLLSFPRERALLDQLWASPVICTDVQQRSMIEIHGETLDLLADAKAEKVIKPLQNEILLTATFGCVFNIAKKQQQNPVLFPEPIELNVLLDLCWDAIAYTKP